MAFLVEFFGYVKSTPIEAAGVIVSNFVNTALVNVEEVFTIKVSDIAHTGPFFLWL